MLVFSLEMEDQHPTEAKSLDPGGLCERDAGAPLIVDVSLMGIAARSSVMLWRAATIVMQSQVPAWTVTGGWRIQEFVKEHPLLPNAFMVPLSGKYNCVTQKKQPLPFLFSSTLFYHSKRLCCDHINGWPSVRNVPESNAKLLLLSTTFPFLIFSSSLLLLFLRLPSMCFLVSIMLSSKDLSLLSPLEPWFHLTWSLSFFHQSHGLLGDEQSDSQPSWSATPSHCVPFLFSILYFYSLLFCSRCSSRVTR